MSSYGRCRFNLRASYSMIIFFFTFLPLNLKTQEVFDSSQDHFLIQSTVYENRRSLIETTFPGPALDASPPSPDQIDENSPPQPPPGDELPRPPSSSDQAKPPTTPLVTPSPPSLPLPLPLSPPSGTKKKSSSNVYMIVGIVVGVITVSVALIIFFLIRSRKIPIKPWTNSGQLQDAFITGKT
ncbi:hypothetical protein AALP_AA8G375500 [Arabis alpina]|uniref:Uncharacterized protein n=1 Tax=Arabis alpina TaxID=50452 RepID=A0A087GBX9_ARAAL|nr:hypothetical protein AALP_AA8G375500 [Arabis alpina]